MEELISLVSQKTGLSHDAATTAVQTVIGYLKDKLTAPLAAQIDGVLSSGQAADSLGDVADSLGGLFSNK
jgi:hypothetical protein